MFKPFKTIKFLLTSKTITTSRTFIGVKPRSGFTLVEFIVAIGLFSIIVAVAIGSVFRVLRTERQAASLIAANSNVSLVLEQMSREIRTGTNFCNSVTGICPPSRLTFINAQSETVTYCLDSEGHLERGIGSTLCGSLTDITPNQVNVRDVVFIISGEEPDDGRQSRVTMSLTISPREGGVSEATVTLQTTISARNLDG